MQQLFIQLKSRLLRITGSLLGNNEDAADAVQETFCRLWQIRDRLYDDKDTTAVAIQTAKNICIDQLRRKKVIQFESLENKHDQNSADNALKHFEATDECRYILELINLCLTPLQRQILEMREIKEMEIQEIATILNMQPTAVRMHLSRARKEIRNLYIKKNER